jgi:hypothetical protein
MQDEFDPTAPSGGGLELDDETEQDAVDMDDTASLLGQLKQIHHDLVTTEFHKDVDVPGYQKLLWMRFVPYPVAKGGRRAKVMRKRFENDDPELVLDSACDTLIDALEQVMLLPPKFAGDPGKDGKNLKPIDDETPVKFDTRLNEIFDLGVDKNGGARGVVRSLFPTEQGIVSVAVELSDWLRDVTRDSNEEFLGE